MIKDKEELQKFANWVAENGGARFQPKSEHEAYRFSFERIGIIYESGKTSNQWTRRAIQMFRDAEAYVPMEGEDPFHNEEQTPMHEPFRLLKMEDKSKPASCTVMKVKNFGAYEMHESLDSKINDWIDTVKDDNFIQDIVINTICWPGNEEVGQHFAYSGYIKYWAL